MKFSGARQCSSVPYVELNSRLSKRPSSHGVLVRITLLRYSKHVFSLNYVMMANEEYVFLFLARLPHIGPGPTHLRGFQITHNDAPQSIGLLWFECSARYRDLYLITHSTLDRHSCPRWDSNPQSQQASGRRPTSYTARPLGSPRICEHEKNKSPNWRKFHYLSGFVFSCLSVFLVVELENAQEDWMFKGVVQSLLTCI